MRALNLSILSYNLSPHALINTNIIVNCINISRLLQYFSSQYLQKFNALIEIEIEMQKKYQVDKRIIVSM